MSLLKYLVVATCVIQATIQRSTPSDDSYVAAVLEYQYTAITSVNVQNYLRFIQEAAEQGADIVVFPELTLINSDPVELQIYGSLTEYPIPALRPDLYHNVLVQMSEAARRHEIYVVINVEEVVNCTAPSLEECPEERRYLFNTNVVLDRQGAVIDRYRKINLFGEFSRTPALSPDLGVFETDFGVTFGHYICFDLMFQVPAIQVVEKMNVTDVIFTTMWFSELPYLTAVQIQEAYAYAMDINFLASGANNVRVGSAGSGIYSGKAGALASTMPGVPTTRLLVARVPKIPGQVQNQTRRPIYDNPSDHDSISLIRDPSIPSHVTRRLVPGAQQFTLTDRTVTCNFQINLRPQDVLDNYPVYNYRAGVFDGVRSYSGMASGGTRICSVFACTGDDLDSCGRRFPQYSSNTTAIFDKLIITASVITPVTDADLEARDTAYFPISVTTSLMPLEPEQYTFTENNDGNTTIYSLSLEIPDEELYSFAIWGRRFATDGEEPDLPLEEIPEESAVTTESNLGPEDIVNPEVTAEPVDIEAVTDSGDGAGVAHLLTKSLLIPVIGLLFVKLI